MRQRWVAVAVVAASATAAVTCVHDDLVDCGEGISCPTGLHCVRDPVLPQTTCASTEQAAACEGHTNGDTCAVGLVTGTCFGGACLPGVCGDRIVDAAEACDDGNTIGSDGCSANCASTEKCGDGIVDLVAGEQCDDGVRGVSGDGCSSRCKIEYLIWRDVSAATPTDRHNYGFVASPSGNVIMFGGSTLAGGSAEVATYNETWEWDGTSWERLILASSPPKLSRFAFAFDPRRERIVVFGGFTSSGTRSDATWEFDGYSWIERTPTTHPSARSDASMACSPTRCVMFGGSIGDGSAGTLNETWEWNGDDWTRYDFQGSAAPSSRSGPALAYDTGRSTFVLWGGFIDTFGLTDTYELPGATGWIPKTPASVPPSSFLGTRVPSAYSPQHNAVFILVDGNAWVNNGATWGSAAAPANMQSQLAFHAVRAHLMASGTPVVGAYEYTTTWNAKLTGRPSGTPNNAAVFDPERGVLIDYELMTGTWEWNGNAWHLAVGPADMPSLINTAMAFDERCHDAIQFGGLKPGSVLSGETWSYDGSWHQLPITGPSARYLHAMTYDPTRQAVIMMSGRDAISTPTFLADMWQLSGPCEARTWTRVEVTTPPGRVDAALAADRDGTVMLFGGMDATGARGDTWLWDGATWTEATGTAPSARYDHSLSFDPRRREIVLGGGRSDGVTRLSDVWRWNGAWQQASTIVTPPARIMFGLAPDRTGSLVMVGGEAGSGSSASDVQRLRYEQPLEPNERCLLDGADEDRDGLIGCADPDCRGRCAPLCPVNIPFDQCTGPRCGDGACQSIEDPLLCPADCQ